MDGGIRRCRPPDPFTGSAAGILKLEGYATLLDLEPGGDGLPEPLFHLEEAPPLLHLISERRYPEDPLLILPRDLGPESLHGRMLAFCCETAQLC